MSPIRLLLIATILVLSSGIALAQRPGPQFRRPLLCEPVEPRTKLEAIDGQYERVLIKGFSQIATLSVRGTDIRVDAVEMRDTASSNRAMGVVIAMRESGPERPSENRSFIDYEEIDPLIRALDTVSRASESVTKLAGFEAKYRTQGDLEVMVFRQGRTSGTAASMTAGICDKVTAFLTLDELDRLRAHIVEAKTRLDEIK